MLRRQTILETVPAITGNFQALANRWAADHSVRLLTWVWEGAEALSREILAEADWTRAEDDLEREITELLEIRIRERIPDGCPVYLQHEKKERESRRPAPAQPKEYDLAFVIRANERVMWPLEAKILRTDGCVTEYVRDITDEFLTCLYAPFSHEGGMLGYLLSGETRVAFNKISALLGVELRAHPEFLDREHRISDHNRNVPAGRNYPRDFRCHHLLISMCRSA